MSDYLTGLEVVATLNIEVFELRELAKKGVLRPFTQSGPTYLPDNRRILRWKRR